jgi:L-threonylcarbamoyladenylate synthase
VTGSQPSIGLRIPSHPVAQALLKAFGSGIAAPSANRFGRISPTTATHVREELGDAVDVILEGGSCEIGLESTIVDVTRGYPTILRPGIITATEIDSALHRAHLPLLHETIDSTPPRVSGSLKSHYAPQTPTKLLTTEEITLFLENIKTHQLPLALMVKSPELFTQKKRQEDVQYVRMPLNFQGYAHDLYKILHELDNKNFKQIIIEDVPLSPDWAAIRDRLLKASFNEDKYLCG